MQIEDITIQFTCSSCQVVVAWQVGMLAIMCRSPAAGNMQTPLQLHTLPYHIVTIGKTRRTHRIHDPELALAVRLLHQRQDQTVVLLDVLELNQGAFAQLSAASRRGQGGAAVSWRPSRQAHEGGRSAEDHIMTHQCVVTDKVQVRGRNKRLIHLVSSIQQPYAWDSLVSAAERNQGSVCLRTRARLTLPCGISWVILNLSQFLIHAHR